MLLDQVKMRVEGDVDTTSSVELKVVIEKGVRIKNSRVRGPAIIGNQTLIEDSYIGPFTSIAANCVIKGVEIEQSIVMDECEIVEAGARISDSLLGKNVVIRKNKTLPKTIQIMAGDSSMIIIP